MLYTMLMDQENRSAPRSAVSIKMSCPASASGWLRLEDLSEGGFLARGGVDLQPGAKLEGVVHVLPLAGDRDVTLSGTVMRVIPDGETEVLGVRIDSFDSPEGETAYKAYVKEIYEDY